MENTAQIGQEIGFDKLAYKDTISIWEKPIIPAIQNVIQEYEKLGLGKFKHETLMVVMGNNGVAKIKESYSQYLEADAKKSKSTVLTEFAVQMFESRIPELLAPLTKSIGELHKAWQSRFEYALIKYTLHFEFDDVEIIESRAVLNKEQVRKRYCAIIEDQIELTAWNHMLKVKSTVDDFAAFLKSVGYPINYRSLIGYDGFFNEILGEATVELNADETKAIKFYINQYAPRTTA